jgi:hypothetical protein
LSLQTALGWRVVVGEPGGGGGTNDRLVVVGGAVEPLVRGAVVGVDAGPCGTIDVGVGFDADRPGVLVESRDPRNTGVVVDFTSARPSPPPCPHAVSATARTAIVKSARRTPTRSRCPIPAATPRGT